ncbi:uncharacterized protein TNCT_63941 [Trichonephila clavata]|uniref:Ciliary microtubule inner protein 2A-C-like domain-containing protein n=1 Tax=Trichonephila clavata TaxID=2740835 RepID=A0A8X6LST4_TRICU|nr:uncharacterized protein TNCT_63941 [Trichonephila clavata]
MKDYTYYIPGYTGFCPKLPDHYGQSYGKATHQILRERPRDLLKERLSAVRHRCHQDRSKERFSADYTGDRHYVDHGRDGHGMDHRIEGHCHDHGDDGRCLDHHCRIRHSGEYSDHDRNRPYTFGYVGPTYVFFEGFTDHAPGYSHEHQKHDRGDLPHVHHPAFMQEPCQHDMHPNKMPCDNKGFDPEARIRMRTKAVPFRHCCVAPKYTGHIPGKST